MPECPSRASSLLQGGHADGKIPQRVVDVTARNDELRVAKQQLGHILVEGHRAHGRIIHGCPPTCSDQYRPPSLRWSQLTELSAVGTGPTHRGSAWQSVRGVDARALRGPPGESIPTARRGDRRRGAGARGQSPLTEPAEAAGNDGRTPAAAWCNRCRGFLRLELATSLRAACGNASRQRSRPPRGSDVSDLSEALKNPVLHCVRSQDSKAPSQREPRGNILTFRSFPPLIQDSGARCYTAPLAAFTVLRGSRLD